MKLTNNRLGDYNQKVIKESIRRNKNAKEKKEDKFQEEVESDLKIEMGSMVRKSTFFYMPDLSHIDWSKG